MKLNSEAIRAGITGKLPEAEKRRRLVWRWWKCVPLIITMMAAGVLLAAVPWVYLLRCLVPW